MDASELKAARERLIFRNTIINGLRERGGAWSELHQVCRDIAQLGQKLGESAADEQSVSDDQRS